MHEPAPTRNRTGRTQLAWLALLVASLAACLAAIATLGRNGQDLVGAIALVTLAVVTVGGRMKLGHDHRPRIRDGAHTLLVGGAWLLAVWLQRRAGAEITISTVGAGVAAGFTIAALLASFGPRWLLARSGGMR